MNLNVIQDRTLFDEFDGERVSGAHKICDECQYLDLVSAFPKVRCNKAVAVISGASLSDLQNFGCERVKAYRNLVRRRER